MFWIGSIPSSPIVRVGCYHCILRISLGVPLGVPLGERGICKVGQLSHLPAFSPKAGHTYQVDHLRELAFTIYDLRHQVFLGNVETVIRRDHVI